jgi:hypothetical protein
MPGSELAGPPVEHVARLRCPPRVDLQRRVTTIQRRLPEADMVGFGDRRERDGGERPCVDGVQARVAVLVDGVEDAGPLPVDGEVRDVVLHLGGDRRELAVAVPVEAPEVSELRREDDQTAGLGSEGGVVVLTLVLTEQWSQRLRAKVEFVELTRRVSRLLPKKQRATGAVIGDAPQAILAEDKLVVLGGDVVTMDRVGEIGRAHV